MSKILLIGDNHHGANGNSKRLMRQAEHFYKSFLLNVIKHYNIEFCVDLGDFFDDREKVDIEVLSHVRNVILKDLPVKWYFTVGNHNLYYKNSDHVNNLTETIGDINNVIVIDNPTTITTSTGESIDIYPWISNSNKDKVIEKINTTSSKYAMGHFEFSGFQFDKSRVADVKEKVAASSFNKYDVVFSGHYHIASRKGNIVYVGTPYQLTWIDCNVEKSVIVLDTVTGEITPVVYNEDLYHIYDLPIDGNIENWSKEMFFDKRVKVVYDVNIAKDVLNNVQAILKQYEADQLTFVPKGVKKNENRVQVSVKNGINESISEYIKFMPVEEKDKVVLEKYLLKLYNEVNKE